MLTAEHIDKLASDLGLEPAVIKAVARVEAPRGPFHKPTDKTPAGYSLKDHPFILFEGHVFWRALGRQRPPTDPGELLIVHDIKDILFPRWSPNRRYGTYNEQWDRLRRAEKFCRPAAREAASYGAFQILGENWRSLGYPSVDKFYESMFTLEGQVEAFVRFLKRSGGALRHLRDKNWEAFARVYNGGGQVETYAQKLKGAYNACRP